MVEATSFCVLIIIMAEKPYSGSYNSVRRHLCGVMDSDDKKGPIGISICPNISMVQRKKYIQI